VELRPFLAFTATLDAYEQQAVDLLADGNAPASEAFGGIDDARRAVARAYEYADWAALSRHVVAMHTVGTPEYRFERAVEAAIEGNTAELARLLAEDPSLAAARSRRETCNEPSVHAATVLHYLAANGVETYRQRSPANAVAIAQLLLRAGADPNALAGMYGGACCVLSLLVSSSPPAEAGVQVPLVHALVEGGADVEGASATAWASPLLTALIFGHIGAARALLAHGARVDTLTKAAGLGDLSAATSMLNDANPLTRHQSLAVAAINGSVDVVRLLLEAGEDPNRYNPDGFHAHQTPLHGAALRGDLALAQLLVAHGARHDIKDRVWQGTPHEWAEHAEQPAVANYLASVGSSQQSPHRSAPGEQR
jgi:hypothetical protein